MKKVNYKKLILPNIPYVFIALIATKLGQAFRLAPGTDFSSKLLGIMDGFSMAFQNIMPSFHPIDLLVGVAAAAIIRLVVYFKGKNAKKYRKNIEYGSARWGTREDIAPFVDPVFENNVILTQTESLMMSNRPKDPKNARNKNVLVIGGSGSGKTRFFLKPNLMQMHSSYVVTDPKGSVVCEVGKLLERNNYKIKIFNTINFKKSMHYNPFAYIHSEKDILKLVTTLITNTKGDGKSGDEFWTKAETLLYTALIGYIHYEAPPEEQNFTTLLEFINAMEVREDDEEYKNPVDRMFDELEEKDPKTYSVIKGAEVLFPSGRDVIGKCPRCGGDVTESKKGYFCETNDCRFGLWRDNKFLAEKKISLSKKMAATLLKSGRIPVKGIFSEKTGNSYDATLVMTDDGTKTLYSLDFGK